jgi:RNA polymerase sigma factor (sigma-70 family)
MEGISDQELLLQIQHGDHDAFDILFDRYWQRLFQSARARLNDSDTAQDIVQEIFIKIWQRRATLNISGPLENYLQSAVRLSVISHYRSKKVTEVQLEDALQRINMLEDSIESLTDYLELEKTLQQTVELMPEMLKRVYQLRSENLILNLYVIGCDCACNPKNTNIKSIINFIFPLLLCLIAARRIRLLMNYISLFCG